VIVTSTVACAPSRVPPRATTVAPRSACVGAATCVKRAVRLLFVVCESVVLDEMTAFTPRPKLAVFLGASTVPRTSASAPASSRGVVQMAPGESLTFRRQVQPAEASSVSGS
jgi:hypothetical protein